MLQGCLALRFAVRAVYCYVGLWVVGLRVPAAFWFSSCPHRLVVRTSRCGRDNPGSTPGVDICCDGRTHRRSPPTCGVGWASRQRYNVHFLGSVLQGRPADRGRQTKAHRRASVLADGLSLREACASPVTAAVFGLPSQVCLAVTLHHKVLLFSGRVWKIMSTRSAVEAHVGPCS